MNPPATKAEWDAPKDGDFARYVERLTAAHVVALPEEPGRVLPLRESLRRPHPIADKQQRVDLQKVPDLHSLRMPLVAMLSLVQIGLVLLVLVQLALLLMAGLGSAFGVGAAIVAWWMVRHWKQALAAGDRSGSRVSETLALFQRQLQMLADQKAASAKKQ
ncbi:MAG: hypothetical protein ACTS8S_13205 [Giesbergeria sp.]